MNVKMMKLIAAPQSNPIAAQVPNVFAIIFVYFYLPETKNKSIQEIQAQMTRKSRVNDIEINNM